jgi:hypothetical protein
VRAVYHFALQNASSELLEIHLNVIVCASEKNAGAVARVLAMVLNKLSSLCTDIHIDERVCALFMRRRFLLLVGLEIMREY